MDDWMALNEENPEKNERCLKALEKGDHKLRFAIRNGNVKVLRPICNTQGAPRLANQFFSENKIDIHYNIFYTQEHVDWKERPKLCTLAKKGLHACLFPDLGCNDLTVIQLERVKTKDVYVSSAYMV